MKCFKGLFLLLSALLVLALGTVAFAQEKGRIEIFSWWTAGGEAEGLQALFDIYSKLYPDRNYQCYCSWWRRGQC